MLLLYGRCNVPFDGQLPHDDAARRAGITVVIDQACSLPVIEAILGKLYLAVLISRLVGAYRMHTPAADT
jgi:hypothetical protein